MLHDLSTSLKLWSRHLPD